MEWNAFTLGRLLKALPLLALLGLTAACTTNPATGEQSFTAFMSPEDELRVGAEEHPKIIAQMGGEYTNAQLQTYVDWMGERIGKVSDLPDLKYRFHVLDDPNVNAFALPGGYIYVTRGLIALADNEAELAGVIAHEIGHVTARHSAQRYSTTQATNLGLNILGVIGSIYGVPGGLTQIAGLGANLALKSYSREQELEADMLAVRYMSRAGYDPKALETFFRKMRKNTSLRQRLLDRPDVDPADDILSTHPKTADRIMQAIRLAKAEPVRNARVGRQDLLDRINGMRFGDAPDQGIVTGRTFEHPELRIRFVVPPGFTLFNSPNQVAAKGPNGAQIIFTALGGNKGREAAVDLVRYVRNWNNGVLENAERINVNGFEAATGAGEGQVDNRLNDVRMVAIRWDRNLIYRFLFVTPREQTAGLNEELRRTTFSFRRLTAKELADIRELKLRVITVNPGDSQESLAALLPYEEFNIDYFQTLNGLEPQDRLVPGTRVKVVTR